MIVFGTQHKPGTNQLTIIPRGSGHTQACLGSSGGAPKSRSGYGRRLTGGWLGAGSLETSTPTKTNFHHFFDYYPNRTFSGGQIPQNKVDATRCRSPTHGGILFFFTIGIGIDQTEMLRQWSTRFHTKRRRSHIQGMGNNNPRPNRLSSNPQIKSTIYVHPHARLPQTHNVPPRQCGAADTRNITKIFSPHPNLILILILILT